MLLLLYLINGSTSLYKPYTQTQKRNLSTPTGEQAPINTPEANSGTVSDQTVPHSPAGVNSESLKSSRTNQDSMLGRLEKQNERLQEEMDYLKQLVKIQKSGNKARFPGESGKEKTSVCTGFANMPPACWI